MPRRRRAATLPAAVARGVLARGAVACSVLACVAAPTHAQRLDSHLPPLPRGDAFRLDVASGALGGSGIAAEGAFGLAPTARLTVGDALALSADVSTAFARSDLLRGRARLAAEPARALFGVVTPVVALRAAQDRVGSFGPSARVDGELALRVGGESAGAWVGAGVARSRHMSALRDVRTVGAGVHVGRGPLRLRASYDGDAFDVPAARDGAATPLRTRLHDVTAEATFTHRLLSLGAFTGQRLGAHVAPTDRQWGGLWAQVPVTAAFVLTARHETTPSDPSRHLPMQRITALGVRLFTGGEREAAAPLRPVAAFALVSLDATRSVLRLRAPLAREVEVAGSFSAWEPRAMVPVRDGWWELVVTLPPGLHQLNWRTDGGAWRVPPGLEAVGDDYDGTVGVVVVTPR